MKKTMAIALRTTLVTLVATGLAYPLLMTGLAQALFHWRAQGSFVEDDRKCVVGSELIGQAVASPAYFQPRPSAAGDKGFDATSSGGSNLGPTSAKLKARVEADVKRLLADNPDAGAPIPLELVTTSGSGLDPHLSREAALWQVPRIAKARHTAPERVRALIEAHLEGRDLFFLGESRANVLQLNLAMDQQFGHP